MREKLIIEDPPKTDFDIQQELLTYEGKTFEEETPLSKLLFMWIYKIVKLSNLRQISINDLGEISEEKSINNFAEKFKEHIKDYKQNNFLFLLFSYHKETLLISLIIHLSLTFMNILYVLLFRQFIQSFTVTNKLETSYYLKIIFELLIIQSLQIFLSKHGENIQNQLSYKLGGELQYLIFNKIFEMENNTKIRPSDIVNYIQIDCQKIILTVTLLPNVLCIPILIFVFCVMLYKYMGFPFIYGIFSLFVLFIINLFLQNDMKKAQKIKQDSIDQRMKVTSEVLYNLKYIKMYGWDETFLNRILDYRDNELFAYNALFKTTNKIRSLLWLSPVITSIISLLAYQYYYGKEIKVENIFICIGILSSIQDPIRNFSNSYTNLMSSIISINRIGDFLKSNEVNTANIVYNDDFTIKNGIDIQIINGTFFYNDNTPILHDISLTINKGDLIFIIGEVGCGKTSLFHAILNTINKTYETNITINGDISYCSQEPFLQNDTIKNNILFYNEYNEFMYYKAIELCELDDDFKSFELGDMTIIGDRGITLSGGQKNRIALARAIYADRDIYLLDDILSSCDNNVSNRIIENCILKYLKDKTRLIISNNLEYLNKADKVLYIKNETIFFYGNYNELEKIGEFVNFKGQILEELNNNEKNNNEKVNNQNNLYKRLKGHHKKTSSLLSYKTTTSRKSKNQKININLNILEMFDTYKKYFKLLGGKHSIIIICFFLFITQITKGYSDVLLTKWTSEYFQNNLGHYVKLFIFLSLVSVLFIYLRLIYISIISLKGGEELHYKMIDRLIKAPINLYHDITSKGNIFNQLSKDLGTVDFLSSVMLGNTLSFGAMFVGILIITSFYQPVCLLFLPLFLYAGLKLMRFYLNCCRPLNNQESKAHQPIINLVYESYDGRETIKAYEKKEKMYLMFIEKIDNYILINDFLKGVNVWFNFVLEIMNLIFRFFLFSFILILRNRVKPEIIGLYFIYTFNIQDYLIRFLYSVSMFENSMMALKRCLNYTEIIQEHPSKKMFDKNLENWPLTGSIQVKNLNIKYRPELNFVLRNINFTINSKEKIGVCGRTGSGKSTLLLSLLRIVETNNDGIIEIDGVNLANLGLEKIRENIAIIPQDPVIFNDTARFNLDPENVYSDEDIFKVINLLELYKITDLNQKIENLSKGEKQLICIGRACLKGSKILLLDEATAYLDGNTERKILKMLYEKFYKESTVICISHRLYTLENCNRIFVFNEGEIVENDTFQNLKNNKNSLFNQLYKGSK